MAVPSQVRNFWAITALVIAALALYGGALRHPPVLDDGQLTGQFLRAYSSSWFKLDLRWFSYATLGWTYSLFGGDRFWLRLGNVLLHAAVAGTLFVFLSRLFRFVTRAQVAAKSGELDPAWYAFFGALIFLVHPAAVYGVAYLMQRPILMATLFSLLALAFFLEGLIRNSRAWLLASVPMYCIAVFSKEHCVMLPAVAAALALVVQGPSWQRLRSLAWPFALYSAIAVLVTLKAKGFLGAQYEPFADAAVRKIRDSTAPLVERSYRNRGVALYKSEKYEAALADFDRALALDPRSAQAWMTRATLFMRTGQTEKALADFDRALQLDARDADTLGRRCVVLLRLRRFEDALQDCRSARDLNPYDPLNHTSLGMVHALRGEVASAEEDYRRAMALDPALADPHYQYGVLLNGVSRTREARQHFVAACRAGNARACDALGRGGAAP